MINHEEIEYVLGYITNSAAFLGALGGMVKAINGKLKIRDALIRIACGSAIASVTGAYIAKSVTPELQPMVIFIVGYMGIEAVDFAVDVFKTALKIRAGVDKVNKE